MCFSRGMRIKCIVCYMSCDGAFAKAEAERVARDVARRVCSNGDESAIARSADMPALIWHLVQRGSIDVLSFRGASLDRHVLPALLDTLQTVRGLRKLYVNATYFGRACTCMLADARHAYAQLEILTIRNPVGSEGTAHIGRLVRLCPTLRRLDVCIRDVTEIPMARGFARALGTSGVYELCLRGGTTPDVWTELCVAHAMQNLVFVELYCMQLEGVAYQQLARVLFDNSAMRQLRAFKCSPVCDAGVAALAQALATNTVLRTLDLADTVICGAGLLGHALRSNSTLCELVLRSCGIGDRAMCELAAGIGVNTTLCELDVCYNDAVGASGAMALAAALHMHPSLHSVYTSCIAQALPVGPQRMQLLGALPRWAHRWHPGNNWHDYSVLLVDIVAGTSVYDWYHDDFRARDFPIVGSTRTANRLAHVTGARSIAGTVRSWGTSESLATAYALATGSHVHFTYLVEHLLRLVARCPQHRADAFRLLRYDLNILHATTRLSIRFQWLVALARLYGQEKHSPVLRAILEDWVPDTPRPAACASTMQVECADAVLVTVPVGESAALSPLATRLSVDSVVPIPFPAWAVCEVLSGCVAKHEIAQLMVLIEVASFLGAPRVLDILVPMLLLAGDDKCVVCLLCGADAWCLTCNCHAHRDVPRAITFRAHTQHASTGPRVLRNEARTLRFCRRAAAHHRWHSIAATVHRGWVGVIH